MHNFFSINSKNIQAVYLFSQSVETEYIAAYIGKEKTKTYTLSTQKNGGFPSFGIFSLILHYTTPVGCV